MMLPRLQSHASCCAKTVDLGDDRRQGGHYLKVLMDEVFGS
jgi:hypothetical protein